ncbi:MAG: hypothetical protein Fur0032_15420 [Terrimicrobiaceae bacterium]
MSNLNWTQKLKAIYEKAVESYRAGERDPDKIFSGEESSWLAGIGLKPVHVYDHADDFVRYGEPDWETFLLVASARRDYFIYVLKREPATREVAAGDLPPKPEELDGVPWLPRIVVKAKAFLEGTLCHDIMYGCGGDRDFLRKFNIHAADFLRLVWACEGDAKRVLEHLRRA